MWLGWWVSFSCLDMLDLGVIWTAMTSQNSNIIKVWWNNICRAKNTLQGTNISPTKALLKMISPEKINIEPENTPLAKENHLSNHHFQVLCQSSEVCPFPMLGSVSSLEGNNSPTQFKAMFGRFPLRPPHLQWLRRVRRSFCPKSMVLGYQYSSTFPNSICYNSCGSASALNVISYGITQPVHY